MVLWGVLIFIITRQVPFVSYSILGNLALLGIVALNMRYDATGFYRTFLPILCWCSFLVFYALLQGNEVTLVARFVLIIFFLLTAYFIILPSRMINPYDITLSIKVGEMFILSQGIFIIYQ